MLGHTKQCDVSSGLGVVVVGARFSCITSNAAPMKKQKPRNYEFLGARKVSAIL